MAKGLKLFIKVQLNDYHRQNQKVFSCRLLIWQGETRGLRGEGETRGLRGEGDEREDEGDSLGNKL